MTRPARRTSEAALALSLRPPSGTSAQERSSGCCRYTSTIDAHSAITSCLRCGNAFDESELECPHCGELRAAADPTVFKKTDVLEGKWRLEKLAGQGGMGTVYSPGICRSIARWR